MVELEKLLEEALESEQAAISLGDMVMADYNGARATAFREALEGSVQG